MGARFSIANLAHLLNLPAHQFAVVDAGQQRARILIATVVRGRPRLVRTEIIDTHEEGFTTPEEQRYEIRRRLQTEAPEAVIVVAPQHQILRHVLDIPPGDATHTRALVEREASNIGGLSDSTWAFDAVRLEPFGGPAHPVVATFCRQSDLQRLLEEVVDDERLIYDVRPAADCLAAAFRAAAPEVSDAVLVDLGARQTGLTVLLDGQAVFATTIPSGSAAFTEALATDRGGSTEAAEVLKRTEPPPWSAEGSPRFHQAAATWLVEMERTLREWRQENPGIRFPDRCTAYLAGGGALQPGLMEGLTAAGIRPFEAWPTSGEADPAQPDTAAAWGALLLGLGHGGPAPSLLPVERRAAWDRQRLWRALVQANLVLAAMLAMAIAAATAYQTRALAQKAAWQGRATDALRHAEDIRYTAEIFNARMDAFRPVLEHQRQTVDTLRVLQALQSERTNANHWYVLLADAASYAAGSNNFAASAGVGRPGDGRFPPPPSVLMSNPPPSNRAFVAEACLVPEGEKMRQALSDLVSDLKRHPLFRNVDVLPAERRRALMATNLIFPERHFALELSLSEIGLLESIPLPRLPTTNREPRNPFRLNVRGEPAGPTNNGRSGRTR